MKSILQSKCVILHLATVLCVVFSSIESKPQDEELVRPLAEFLKMGLGSALLGDPFNVNLSVKNLVKGLPGLLWRTGFPLKIPSGVIEKSQALYDRVNEQLAAADVKNVERKTFVSLKQNIDKIIDSVVAEVGRSNDGVVMDYTKVMVDDETLEQALFNVGLQLKAYKVDLINYRDIAKAVLGIPLVPTMASSVVNVANMPGNALNYAGVDPSQITNIAVGTVTQFGQSAAQTVMNPASLIANRVSGLSDYVPGMQNMPFMKDTYSSQPVAAY